MRVVKMMQRDRDVDNDQILADQLLQPGTLPDGTHQPDVVADPEPGPDLSLGTCLCCGATDVVTERYKECKRCREEDMAWT
jgi:hypothetical protein